MGASGKLGPVLTLTNSGGGIGASAAVDFNSYGPSTNGTYNPAARIDALDDNWGDDIIFYSNIQGAPNHGLQENMVISADGQIGINFDDLAGTEEQFIVYGATGNAAVAGMGGYGSGQGGLPGALFEGGGADSTDSGGDGLDAYAGESTGGSTGFAGLFYGDVLVSGTLTAGAKNFKIDDPIDPANKYLYHASVESSEMMDIYIGNVITDELGLATVKLPDWFEAENTDFRYQLTVIGRKAQAWVAEEVNHEQFKIASDATNTKVSWQITAVRRDVYAVANPLIIEQEKPQRERGYYMHPELYGQPEEKQTEWGRHPREMQRMKELRKRQQLAAQGKDDGVQAGRTLSHDQPASAVDNHFPTLPSPAVNHLSLPAVSAMKPIAEIKQP